MVTGVETAGLVLAAFPVIVNGLIRFTETIDTIKSWRKYQCELKEYGLRLEMQQIFCLDTLEELLEGIVHSDDIRVEMINHSEAEFWRQPEYEEKLRLRLGRSYDVYLATVSRMLKALE